ncbi:hypothetical protein D3C74_324330 [compost metagenome]
MRGAAGNREVTGLLDAVADHEPNLCGAELCPHQLGGYGHHGDEYLSECLPILSRGLRHLLSSQDGRIAEGTFAGHASGQLDDAQKNSLHRHAVCRGANVL